MVSAFLCDRPGHGSARLLAIPTQTVRGDCLLVVGVTPTGNRDAGKFAADATQLPTGCQPESLAKPARRRSHKPQRVYRHPEKKPRSGRGRGLEFRGFPTYRACQLGAALL